MKVSLATSLGLHAAILVAALVVLPNPSPHEVKPVEAITVDISNISDANKIMAMSKAAEKPVQKPAPKKAEIVKKVEPTLKVAEKEKKAAKEAKAPPPPPEPKKEEPKKEEAPPPDPDAMAELLKKTMEEAPPKKKELKKAEEKPVKKAEKKPEKKTEKKLDVAALEEMLNNDSLLDKENDERTTNTSEAVADGTQAPGAKELQGNDMSLSATAISALSQRVRECWVVPPGAVEAVEFVKVRFQLNQDGSVAGAPQVLNGPGDFIFDTTARSAVSAILSCQNYDFLPKEQYDAWKDLILNLFPRDASNSNPT